MGVIDFILNLAGILLWLNWRSAAMPVAAAVPGRSLASTLRRAHAAQASGWPSLLALAALLLVRAFFYWQAGPALNWTAMLDLQVVAIPFRSDFPGRMLLFSLLSFSRGLLVAYAWLALLSALHHGEAASPAARMVAWQMGRLHRWPRALKVCLPFLMVGLAWLAAGPVLARLGLLPPSGTAGQRVWQGVILGVAVYLAWVPLAVGLLLLHTVESHVHMGDFAFWDFVRASARGLLRPWRNLPLRLGRVDVTAVVWAGLLLAAGRLAAGWLGALYPAFSP